MNPKESAGNGEASHTPTKQRQSVLDRIASLSIIVASTAVVWLVVQNQLQRPTSRASELPRPSPPAELQSLDGVALQGSDHARIVLIQYSDFQCPYCARFARDTLPKLVQDYVRPGKLLIAFKHFPLSIHASAMKAAESAECARRQGRFWDMHDSLFSKEQQMDDGALHVMASRLGLNVKEFTSCLAGEATESVNRDLADAKKLTLSSTPTFLLGSLQPDGRVKVVQILSGARPLAQFRTALDKLISAAPSIE